MKEEPTFKILVVEDDEGIRKSTEIFFNHTRINTPKGEFGLSVETASNGEEALYKLGLIDDFHLVISDIDMPVMDGLELLRSVRSGIGPISEIPFLIVSGRNNIDHAIKAGANAIFSKPYSLNELGRVVEDLLQEISPV